MASASDDEWAVTDDVNSQPFIPETVIRAEYPGFSDLRMRNNRLR
jgi:hypothetical protein